MNAPHLKKYFWDTDIQNLDPQQHKTYIVERILELGDEEAVAWMKKNFDRDEILRIVNQSRRVSPKSRNFWNLVLTP